MCTIINDLGSKKEMTQFYVTNIILSENSTFTGNEIRDKVHEKLEQLHYDNAYINSYAVSKMINDTLSLFTENEILDCFNGKYTPTKKHKIKVAHAS